MHGFPCPKCKSLTLVNDSRRAHELVRRRRHCTNPECSYRFTTFEQIGRAAVVDVLPGLRKAEAELSKVLAKLESS